MESLKLEVRNRYRNLSDEDLIEKAKEKAGKNINEFTGYSYLSVFKAIYELIETPIPFESVKMLSGFGLGFGWSGNICGALSGGMAALGLVYGRSEPEPDMEKFSKIVRDKKRSPEEKLEAISPLMKDKAIYNQLVNRFKHKFGTCLCKDLFQPWRDDPICIERYKKCHGVIIETAGLVMELLLEADRNGLDSFEPGETAYNYLIEDL